MIRPMRYALATLLAFMLSASPALAEEASGTGESVGAGEPVVLEEVSQPDEVQPTDQLAPQGEEAPGSVGAQDVIAAAQEPSSASEDTADVAQEQGEADEPGLTAQTASRPSIRYRSHVQQIGWQDWSFDGDVTGSFGRSLRLESFRIELVDGAGNLLPGISYQTHVQSIGWQDAVSDGDLAGTEGRSLRAEAIRIWLSDELAKTYDVWYSAHVQTFGWLGWAKNGESAGSAGISRRVEALRVMLLEKGDTAPEQVDAEPFVDGTAYLEMEGHVQHVGWSAGAGTVGTVGRGLRMEAVKARLVGGAYEGEVHYSAHVQGIGWQPEASNGGIAGTSGQSRRVEGMTIRLSGEAADHYDVWYRMHVQRYGWLDWAKNGERAGTEGLSLRCESIETKVLPKGMEPDGVGTAEYGCYVTQEDVAAASKGQPLAEANATQRMLVQSAYSTPSAPAGYCAQWVEDVYANAGLGRFYGDACDLYHEYCFSSDLMQLKAGMIVCVSTHPHTSAGSIWGHVGVFVGDGTVRDSVYGYVRTSTLEEWMAYYGVTVPVKWGWIGNVAVA